MATAGVEGAITGNGADFLGVRDMDQKIREHGSVALVDRGEFHRPDAAGHRVHHQPLSFIGLARPRRGHGPSSPQDLDPGAIHQQV